MAGCSRRYKTPHKADVQEIRSSKPNWTLLWPPELTTGPNIAPHSPLFHLTMDRQEKWAPSQLRTIWKKRFKMVFVVVFGTRLTQVFHSLLGSHSHSAHVMTPWLSWYSCDGRSGRDPTDALCSTRALVMPEPEPEWRLRPESESGHLGGQFYHHYSRSM